MVILVKRAIFVLQNVRTLTKQRVASRRKERRMKQSRTRWVLLLAVLMVSAAGFIPRTEHSTPKQAAESLLRDVDYERDWLSERTTRTALPSEISSRIMPPTARTHAWRSRTHASCATLVSNLLTPDKHNALGVQTTGTRHLTCFASRAADYYIFALRHIII